MFITVDEHNKDMVRVANALDKISEAISGTAKILERHEQLIRTLSGEALVKAEVLDSILDVLVDNKLITSEEKNIIIDRAEDMRKEVE